MMGCARLAAAFLLLTTATATADPWPQWRGPEGNGVCRESGVPVTWTPDEVAWRVEFPGRGASTPIVWGDNVFLTSQDEKNDLWVVCIDRAAGRIRWTDRVGNGTARTHQLNNCACASPVTDGKRVWAEFATGDIACYDVDGRQVWRRNLQKDYGEYTIRWGMSSSPVLFGDSVITVCLNHRHAYIAALGKADGAAKWKLNEAGIKGEQGDAYSTPVIFRARGKAEMIVSGADAVVAYDPADGSKLWRCEGVTGRVVGTPAATDKLIVATSSHGGPVLGIRPGGSGDVTKSHVKWTVTKNTPDVPSPLAHDGLVYWVTDAGIAMCIDAASGEVVWRERLNARFWSSPVWAEGRLYCIAESGDLLVLAADRAFRRIATNSIGETECMASPAISDGQILLRAKSHLYCIGKRKGA